MNPAAVTTDLLHDLVAGSHAEGVTAMAVASTIDHHGAILLVVEPGDDFIDDTWELPTGLVLPGDTLDNTLAKAVAALGLHLDEISAYLGHHDRYDTNSELTRVFCFAVTVTNPHSICRSARIGHWWADPADLPVLLAPAELGPPLRPVGGAPSAPPRAEDPPLAGPLRACVRHLYAAEAGTELLIRHATWLDRSDFRERFVHTTTSITGDTETAAINWLAAIAALDAGQLPCSSSEARILRLAASLADGTPANLCDTLTGLDAGNADLVSQAIVHATGRAPQESRPTRSTVS